MNTRRYPMSKRTHQRKQWRLEMAQPQQQQQTPRYTEQEEKERIKQQMDPRHNQD